MRFLSKQETKALEENPGQLTVIQPAVSLHSGEETEETQELTRKYLQILSWARHHPGTDCGFHKRKKVLAQLLGSDPVYHVKYRNWNAVWGIDVDGVLALLYYSTRGLEVDLVGYPGAPLDHDDLPAVRKVIEELHTRLSPV